MMKISVRKLMESVITERDDTTRHDEIGKDSHSIITTVIQTIKGFIGLNVQLYNAIKDPSANTDTQSLLSDLSQITSDSMKITVNNTTFQVSAKNVNQFIIDNPKTNPDSAGAAGYYQDSTITIFNQKLSFGIYVLAQQFSTDRANKNLHYMMEKGLGIDKLKAQINDLLVEFNRAIVKNSRNLEMFMHHELTHNYDENTPAKTAPGLNVMSADAVKREKMNTKTTDVIADYNNLNTETNAIFFEYLPRFIREYNEKGRDMKSFIPYVKDVIDYNEGLTTDNMKKFLSRLYTFLTNTSDEQQQDAITRLKNYNGNNMAKVS